MTTVADIALYGRSDSVVDMKAFAAELRRKTQSPDVIKLCDMVMAVVPCRHGEQDVNTAPQDVNISAPDANADVNTAPQDRKAYMRDYMAKRRAKPAEE